MNASAEAPRQEIKVAEQVLTFALAGETYGVDILKVREIRGWSSVTPIPHAPSDVLGVLNLRGAIVPIIDLRTRFGLPPSERTPLTVIIVLTVERRGRVRDVGLVVDSVSDVADLKSNDIKQAPEMCNSMGENQLLGLASVGERMVLLLNTETLVCDDSPMSM